MSARRNLVIVALALVSPLAASAQPSPPPSKAETEFRRGKELMAAGMLAPACEAFANSQALEPNVSTLLNLANCREKNNELATAHKLFTDAAIQTDRSSDIKMVQLHGVALDRAAKLGPRVSVVTVEVPAAIRVPGLTIKRDGNVIEPATWGIPFELDGGNYTFEASAAGYQPWSVQVTLSVERERKIIAIPPLTPVSTAVVDTIKPDTTTPDTSKPDTSKPDKPDGTTTPDDTTTPGPAPVSPPPPRSRTLAYAVSIGGLALAGTALGFHLWARSTYADAVAEGNDAEQMDLWHSANTKRYVAIGTGVTGVAAIGVGVWLFLRKAPDDERVSVAPAISRGGATLVVKGHF